MKTTVCSSFNNSFQLSSSAFQRLHGCKTRVGSDGRSKVLWQDFTGKHSCQMSKMEDWSFLSLSVKNPKSSRCPHIPQYAHPGLMATTGEKDQRDQKLPKVGERCHVAAFICHTACLVMTAMSNSPALSMKTH